MNETDVKRVVEQKHRQLVERQSKLTDLAEKRSGAPDPLHSAEETYAEAEGVQKGIDALEEVLESITAAENNLPQ